MTQAQRTLEGVTVLVTRPEGQSQDLTQRLTEGGAGVVHLPLLEIQAITDCASARTGLERLKDRDLVIFVSRNAVDHAHALSGGRLAQWSRDTEIASIGRATSAALARVGVRVSVEAAPPFSSEALLEAFRGRDLRGREVVIVRGRGGRETLAQTLTRHGAKVQYLEVYRRVAPRYSPSRIRAVLGDRAVDLITLTSAQSLQNLLSLATSAGISLSGRPVLVASPRLAECARHEGLHEIHIARDATDVAMYEAIVSWGQGSGSRSR